MAEIKQFDHLDTGIIESEGFKLKRVFTTSSRHDPIDITKIALKYAKELAKDKEVATRKLTLGDHTYVDVYIK